MGSGRSRRADLWLGFDSVRHRLSLDAVTWRFASLAAACLVAACSSLQRAGPPGTYNGAWSIYLANLGTFSSPRAADLNGDGVADIILGAGRQAIMATDTAGVALDGRTGRLLWRVGARDQIFRSATLPSLARRGAIAVVTAG